jgi:heat-inducible transcriptional repressor
MDVGARLLHARLTDPGLSSTEREFLGTLAPAFTELEGTAESTLFMDGAARLMGENRFQELSQLAGLMDALERRVSLLGVLRESLDQPSLYLKIGEENAIPELRSLSFVAAGYGLARRNLGAVSVVGPVRMDYPLAIAAVRQAAGELSRYVAEVYDE